MAQYIRKRRKPVSEINVVPYIDVMLVLLIIFMVTAPLISQGVQIDLPDADAQIVDTPENEPLIASIDASGRYYLNVGDAQDTPLSRVDIQAMIEVEVANDPQRAVYLKADGSVPYDDIIQLMVLMQQAGVPSVGLMTEPEQ